MPYYQTGDYATGGYYQGDPGLGRLFKRIVKVGRKILPYAASFIPGVGGVVASLASRAIAPRAPAPRVQYEPTQYPSFPGTGLQPSFPTFRGPPDPMSGRYGPVAKIPISAAGCPSCPSGTHPAKDGSGRCVTNRRMNPLNPRALRRAIRRQEGFGRLAKRMGYVKRKR